MNVGFNVPNNLINVFLFEICHLSTCIALGDRLFRYEVGSALHCLYFTKNKGVGYWKLFDISI